MMQKGRDESLHALLGWIAGMCADEEPHHLIAQKVMEAKAAAHDLEADLDRLRVVAAAALAGARVYEHQGGHIGTFIAREDVE